jgi:hypothetical protein
MVVLSCRMNGVLRLSLRDLIITKEPWPLPYLRKGNVLSVISD